MSAAARQGSAGTMSFLDVQFQYDSLEDAFPTLTEAEINFNPYGSMVLVQIRQSKSKTKGGILLTEQLREADKSNVQIAKVLKWGPLAFHNRETMKPWPEGNWCKAGDFIRVPKHTNDRWEIVKKGVAEPVMLCLFNDLDLKGEVPNPLTTKTFV